MNISTWLTPLLSLIGALLGGVGSIFVTELFRRRNEEAKFVREARVALERWHATRNGPSDISYPGRSEELMKAVGDEEFRKFFARHFSATLEAKAALGTVRHLDPRIANVLDTDDWRIPESSINELREALAAAEIKALRLSGRKNS